MMGTGDSRLSDHVVIVGYGINGRNVARVLRSIHIRYTVLEMNPEAVRTARERGESIGYGDATRAEVLGYTGIESARIRDRPTYPRVALR